MSQGGVLRGAATMVGSRAFGLIFTLIQIKVATAYLGPAGYGLLSTAMLLVGVFEALTELGIGAIVTRRVAGGADLRHNVGLSQALTVMLAVPLILVATVTGLVLYDDVQVRLGCAILAVGLGGTAWAATYLPVAQTTDKFGGISAADIIGRALSLALVLVAVVGGYGLTAFFIASVSAPLARGVVAHLWGRRQGTWHPIWNFAEIRALVVEALPMTYITVISGVYFNLDGLLLTKLTTPTEVGAYNFAYRIIVNVNIISSALSAVLAARFSRAAARSDEAFALVLRRALPLVLVICLPIAVLLGPFSPNIIRLLGSEEFVPVSTAPLTLLWISVAIALLTTVISAALVAGHQQGLLVVLNTVNLGLNAILNIALIPSLGASGAAIALIVTEASGLLVCLVVLARRLGPGFFPVGQSLILVGCATIAFVVERFAGPLPWVLRGLVVAGTFFALAYAFRIATPAKFRELSDAA